MSALTQDIEQYWTERAEGYSKVNQEELFSEQKDKWRKVILEHLPHDLTGVKVLDVGTGPGFFAILLAELGLNVTAVDYTAEMLREAKKNAGDLAEKINWRQMDAQALELQDETFDLLVTRNVTWNLQKPEQAYREWHRVLKKGGVMLNFDANWYCYLYDASLRESYEQDRINAQKCQVEDFYEGTDIEEMERIAREVPLSRIKRPEWDLKILEEIGFSSHEADTVVGERVLSVAEKINYRTTPIFMVVGVK